MYLLHVQALSKAGFPTKPRPADASSGAVADMLASKRRAREEALQKATSNLITAWGLAAVSALGHLAHALPHGSVPGWLHVLHSTPLQAALSVAALLGPGRDIMVQGFHALMQVRREGQTD